MKVTALKFSIILFSEQNSHTPNKWKLEGTDINDQNAIETTVQNLATLMSQTLKKAAPSAHSNMMKNCDVAEKCRIGNGTEKVFSGMTAVMDFCAHRHLDFRLVNLFSFL